MRAVVTQVAFHFYSRTDGNQLCSFHPYSPRPHLWGCLPMETWRGDGMGPPKQSGLLRTQPCSQDRQVTDGDWD